MRTNIVLHLLIPGSLILLCTDAVTGERAIWAPWTGCWKPTSLVLIFGLCILGRIIPWVERLVDH